MHYFRKKCLLKKETITSGDCLCVVCPWNFGAHTWKSGQTCRSTKALLFINSTAITKFTLGSRNVIFQAGGWRKHTISLSFELALAISKENLNMCAALSLPVDLQAGLVGLTTFLFTKWLLQPSKQSRLPPGPPGQLYFGHALRLNGNKELHKVFTEWKREYGDIYTLKIGRYNMMVLGSYQVIRDLILDKAEITSHRPDLPFLVKLWFMNKKGIINNDGESWRDQRRAALVSLRDFGVGKRSIEERILEEADTITNLLEESKGQSVDLRAPFVNATTNVICSVVYGQRYSGDDEEFQSIMKDLTFLFSIGGPQNLLQFVPEVMLLTAPLLIPYMYWNVQPVFRMISLFKRKIKDHRSTFDPNNIRDLVDVCLEAEGSKPGNVSDSHIFWTMIDLFFTGTETSSVTLRWAILFLLHNPAAQNRCREEILQVIGESRLPAYADRSKMPYIEATVQETLRRGNTAAFTLPHKTIEDISYRGYLIPKGTILFPNIYAVHLDEKNFQDPMNFRPERWLDKDGKFTKANVFLPFGLGPRECPGRSLAYQEVFLILTSLLQKYRFTATDPDNLPSLEGKCGISHCPEPYKVNVTRL